MRYIYSKSKNKFETSQFVAKTEEHKQIALANGYVEVSDEDFEKLVNHELCWENEVLVPYTKTAEEIETEQRQAINVDIMQRIAELKSKLAETDYRAIKYAEGALTEAEYAETKAQRTAWRDEINQLESELEQL